MKNHNFISMFLTGSLLALVPSNELLAQGTLLLEIKTSGTECRRLCREGSFGGRDHTCKMAYYYHSNKGAKANTCRVTIDGEPNTRMRGTYNIYSPYLDRWLTKELIARHWPNLPLANWNSNGSDQVKPQNLQPLSKKNKNAWATLWCYKAYMDNVVNGPTGKGKGFMYVGTKPNGKLVCSSTSQNSRITTAMKDRSYLSCTSATPLDNCTLAHQW